MPAYGYYCHSIDDFVTPWRWIWELEQRSTPVEWTVLLAALETLIACALFSRPLRPMVARLGASSLATAGLFSLCMAVAAGWAYPGAMAAYFAGRPWGLATSIWEPRYLGFIWPAVGVAVAALLMRLPTRAVRIAAITFFCLANLFMFGMRMTLSTEPPIDLLAADVWAAQGPNATTRTYDDVGGRPNSEGPQAHQEREGIEVAATSLGVTNMKIAGGRYYLQMHGDRPLSPDLFEHSLWPDVPHPYTLRERLDPGAVRFDMRNGNKVRRVIFWTQLFGSEKLAYDAYRTALPPGFRLTDEKVFPVRVIWDWRGKWRWVRREYVRTARPAK